MAESLSYKFDSINSNNANLRLDDNVTKLNQVSDTRSAALKKLGITSIRNLLDYFPKRYIDLTHISSIADTQSGYYFTICAQVYKIEKKDPKPKLNLIEITLVDKTGTLITTSFRQNWLLEQVKENDIVAVSGKVETNYGFKRMTNPFIHVLKNDVGPDKYAKIIPIYKASKDLSSAQIFRITKTAIDYIGNGASIVPKNLKEKYKLDNYFESIKELHNPNNKNQLNKAKRTVKFTKALIWYTNYYSYYCPQDTHEKCYEHNICGENLKVALAYTEKSSSKQYMHYFSKLLANLALDKESKSIITCESCHDKHKMILSFVSVCIDSNTDAIVIYSSKAKAMQSKQYYEHLISSLNIKANIYLDINEHMFYNKTYILLFTTKQDITFDNLEFSHIIVDEMLNCNLNKLLNLLTINNEKLPDVSMFTSSALYENFNNVYFESFDNYYIEQKRVNKIKVEVLQKNSSIVAYDEICKRAENSQKCIVFSPLIGIDYDKRNDLAKKDFDYANYESRSYDIVSIDSITNANINKVSKSNSQVKAFESTSFGTTEFKTLSNDLSADQQLDLLVEFDKENLNILNYVGCLDVLPMSKNITGVIVEDADRIGLSTLFQLKNLICDCKNACMFLLCASKQKDAIERLKLLDKYDDAQVLVKKDFVLRKNDITPKNCILDLSFMNIFDVDKDKAILDTAKNDAKKIMNIDPNLKMKEHINLAYEISRTF